ncbi:TetR/AcrR family transcriptional regulator C-terminal domain-containing protein [Kribbella jiaozuonensis]|uniref:TetR family transcriptional regulator n=1 Tax=Kribbella jiaozuonensis TaxID=2575441 RepID=A0A4V6XB36_9ACTN|nr:TetR/AcrR family transcriptional regulator C-terminal domain-containing protein [Kribbella jiaozuonensis]TKK76553.1 TetR family transcriptional regulator [Kribbella jiaozuonensis]
MSLDRTKIVDEAVALLDAEGLDGVTLRKLAARLGVQAPTLYWHLPNKAALVTAIAEAIVPDPTPAAPDQPWQEWLTDFALQLRAALLAHPDGARVVSMAQLSRQTAAWSELAMSTLADRGIPLHNARIIVLTVERFTVGHALEEQSPRPDTADFDLEQYRAAYPVSMRAITEYFTPGRDVDDLFRDCLEVVVEGASVIARQ